MARFDGKGDASSSINAAKAGYRLDLTQKIEKDVPRTE